MNAKQDEPSHLFLVRFWSEEVGDHNSWRGRVQHVLSGEARTFHDWPALIGLLVEMAETDRIEVRTPGDNTGGRPD